MTLSNPIVHARSMVCGLQGVLNGIPRSALHFSTMYFQYCNIPDWWASFIVSSSWLAAMVIAPVIGCVGDHVYSKYPHHGRQSLAQVCIVARCVLMSVMLTCVPRKADSLWTFLALAILIGFLAGWPGVGVNRPILAEIVWPEHRATAFALVRITVPVALASRKSKAQWDISASWPKRALVCKVSSGVPGYLCS